MIKTVTSIFSDQSVKEADMNKENYMTACFDSAIIDAWSNGPYQKKDTSDSVGVNEHSGCQFRLYPEAEDKNKLCDIKAQAVICRCEAA